MHVKHATMAYAFGKRLAACLVWLVSTITVIGIPFGWPIAWKIYKSAKQAEHEAELRRRRLEADVSD